MQRTFNSFCNRGTHSAGGIRMRNFILERGSVKTALSLRTRGKTLSFAVFLEKKSVLVFLFCLSFQTLYLLSRSTEAKLAQCASLHSLSDNYWRSDMCPSLAIIEKRERRNVVNDVSPVKQGRVYPKLEQQERKQPSPFLWEHARNAWGFA